MVIHTKTFGENAHHQTFHCKMECIIQMENTYVTCIAVSPESDRLGSLSEIWVTLGASTAETVQAHKKSIQMGTPLALTVIDGRLR